ncbi:hypothetical protein [Noviherbaspirillum galbum]|uniref:Type IV pilus biogenesis protein PilP n=1 Tax=Noviherbaspirillum galbum TaxID=2709383 RepID=A0A6B3SUQ1_9BURK|nr:hypothetical protein [Noviherbaspirillum galbum]NEX64218.1 hypothetical protein [Noviherbaspirillum galbum]
MRFLLQRRLAVIAAFVVIAPAHASDVDSLVSQQRELMKKQAQLTLLKAEKQILDEQASLKPGMSAVMGSPRDKGPVLEDLQLMGIYGIGDKLEAQVRAGGILRSYHQGDMLLGWKLASIDRDSITISRKPNRRKPVQTRTIDMYAPAVIETGPIVLNLVQPTVPDLQGAQRNPRLSSNPGPGDLTAGNLPRQPRFGVN